MNGSIRAKAALFMDSFYPGLDGPTLVLDNYARYLQTRKDGAFVVAPAFSRVPYDDRVHAYEVYRLKSLGLPLEQYSSYRMIAPSLNHHLLQQIGAKEIDICHAHTPFMAARIAGTIARRKKIPLVMTLHTKYKDDIRVSTKSNLLAEAGGKLIVDIMNKATEVWAVNKPCADILRDYGYKRDIQVMYNGVDISPPPDPGLAAREIRNLHHIDEAEKLFLFVGRLTLLKGIDLSLKALALYKQRGNRFKFIMIGFGHDEQAIKKLIMELGLSEDVIMPGKITSRPLLVKYYCAADLLLFPSAYDTDSLVPKEAAACGTPSLLLRGAPTAASFQDNLTGYLLTGGGEVSYCDRIEGIFARPELLLQVGNAARSVVQSWDQAVETAYARYGEIIRTYRHLRENRR
jgi:glycosyltransferase involved in cell wall biosynthesis